MKKDVQDEEMKKKKKYLIVKEDEIWQDNKFCHHLE